MWGKFVCWITRKHLRGKRTGFAPGGKVQFQCPRCRAMWTRSNGKPKQAALPV